MGVNFYANSREGKPFVPIEKWTHLEGSGGIVDAKVDTLSARVWVELINKALLCESEKGFTEAFPYFESLMDMLSRPVEKSTLDEFCNRLKSLPMDYMLVLTDHAGTHARLKRLIQQLLTDMRQADTEDARWRAFARWCRFYMDCVNGASSNWLSHGCMLWEYVAAYAGLGDRNLQNPVQWWYESVARSICSLDTGLCADALAHAKYFIGPSFQHMMLFGSFGQDKDDFISDNTLWRVRCLTRRPTISHLWGLYGDAICAREFGQHLLFFNQPEPEEIKAMMEPVTRIGIINAFRNDAYVLELDSVSKDAEVVCTSMWKAWLRV